MQLGMIGLGRMGANMVRRLMKAGHECVVYDVSADAVKGLAVKVRSAATASRTSWRSSRNLERCGSWCPRRSSIRRLPTSRRCSPPATRSSTAATRTTATTSTGRAPAAGRHPLRRRGHQRRRVRSGAGLLPDDRWRGRDRRAPRPDLRHLGAGRRDRGAHAGPIGGSVEGRAGLPALRAERCRPLHEDGAQRHRVRAHGRVRRRPQRAEEGEHRQAEPRARRRDHAAARPEVLPVRHRRPRGHRAVASGQRRGELAARPHRARADGRPRAVRVRWARVRQRRGPLDDPGCGRRRRPVHVLSASLYDRFESRGEADYANKVLSAMRKEFGGHHEKKD